MEMMSIVSNTVAQVFLFMGLEVVVLLCAAAYIVVAFKISKRSEDRLVASSLKECGLD